MKKIAFIFMATLLIGVLSCTKSSDDDPPAPTPDYTIKYSATSTGTATFDTIMYMDVDGVEKYVYDTSNFEHSFVQPSTNYHGKMYISVNIENGSANYSLIIEDKDGAIIDIKDDSGSSTVDVTYKWWAEFIHTEN